MILPKEKLFLCDYRWKMEKQISKAEVRNNYVIEIHMYFTRLLLKANIILHLNSKLSIW